MERRFFTGADALLAAVAATAAVLLLAWFLIPRPGALYAEITTETETFTVALSKVEKSYTQTLSSAGHTLTLTFEKNAVSVTESDCPDKCCVACGRLTKNGQSAVCLPAKVIVRVYASGEREVDAVL